jgi:hypothetical protein
MDITRLFARKVPEPKQHEQNPKETKKTQMPTQEKSDWCTKEEKSRR